MNHELEGFCCAMRRHFLIGIVGARRGDPPAEHLDFMLEFDPPTIAIKFCPFCGSNINNDQALRCATRLDKGEEQG